MITSLLLLAEIGSIEKSVITVLVVAGGFALGFIATGVVSFLLNRFIFPKPSPERLVRLAKALGGAAAAVAAYMLITGEGGLGLGGRGGSRSLSSNDGANAPKTQDSRAPHVETPPDQKTKEKKQALRGTPLSVFVLGVDAGIDRPYRFEAEPQPLSEAEILERIEQLEKAGKLENKLIEVKSGSENMSVPMYAKIMSRLRIELEPRGFKIIPLTRETTAPKG